MFCSECRTVDEVLKPSNTKCNTSSAEPFRKISDVMEKMVKAKPGQNEIIHHKILLLKWVTRKLGHVTEAPHFPYNDKIKS
jgi:hypothetical protein